MATRKQSSRTSTASEQRAERSPLALAASIAGRATLLGVHFSRGMFEFISPDESGSVAGEIGTRVEHSLADSALRSTVNIVIEVPCPDPERGQRIRISAAIELSYNLSGDAPPNAKEAECFAKINGVYNAWPYWREFVQHCTTRMGLPPLTLPLMTAARALAHAGFRESGPDPSADDKSGG